MRLAHRRALEALGITLKLDIGVPREFPGETFAEFEIAEDADNWDSAIELLRQWDIEFGEKVSESLRVHTKFTKREMRSADWLAVGAWHHGYPQPEVGDEYRSLTYDPTDYCDECRVGLRQVAAFRMAREPKWGKRGIMQLYFVYGELFVKPEVWERVFKPAGVLCRPVENRSGAELKTEVQLVVEEDVSVETTGHSTQQCGKCGNARPNQPLRGFFPMMRSRPCRPIARTNEYFESWGEAHRCVLVRKDLYRAIEENGVQGATYRPVLPNPSLA